MRDVTGAKQQSQNGISSNKENIVSLREGERGRERKVGGEREREGERRIHMYGPTSLLYRLSLHKKMVVEFFFFPMVRARLSVAMESLHQCISSMETLNM